MISSDFDLDPSKATNLETVIVPSTVHPPESIFPIRRLNIGSSAQQQRRGGRRRDDEGQTTSGKYYNKSSGLWRECKIAGTDLVVYNMRGLEGDELANCNKGGGREAGVVDGALWELFVMLPTDSRKREGIDDPRRVVIPIGRLSMVIACTKRHM